MNFSYEIANISYENEHVSYEIKGEVQGLGCFFTKEMSERRISSVEGREYLGLYAHMLGARRFDEAYDVALHGSRIARIGARDLGDYQVLGFF